MIKVAIAVPYARASWLGGASYYRNLLEAARHFDRNVVDPLILTGLHCSWPLAAHHGSIPVIRATMLDRFSLSWTLRHSLSWFGIEDYFLQRQLRDLGINVLSHYVTKLREVATLGWIPDFQFKRYPNFFSKPELHTRDNHARRVINQCSRVIVSSQAAKDDLACFYPDGLSKARVLRFVASVPHLASLASRFQLEKRYSLPKVYIHLPNQFWMHKNHEVVIEALAELRSRRKRISIVATGHRDDRRQPGYYSRLMLRASDLGIEEDLRVLGVLPYADVLALMRHSRAVLNPSLFEGWSTSVEEAKSLGRHIILSDIPVHREQAPPRVSYFNPHDASALADILAQFAEPTIRSEDENLDASTLQPELEARTRDFARSYQDIIQESAK